MANIVLYSHYNPKKVYKLRKFRENAKPNKLKIGNELNSIDELIDLANNKRSVVINNHRLIPAICVLMWQCNAVYNLVKNKKIKVYLKEIQK